MFLRDSKFLRGLQVDNFQVGGTIALVAKATRTRRVCADIKGSAGAKRGYSALIVLTGLTGGTTSKDTCSCTLTNNRLIFYYSKNVFY